VFKSNRDNGYERPASVINRWWTMAGPGAVALLLLALTLLWPTPTADAQCGTQTSSCKNCHEVQGQDPVNTEGEWHTAHAFGDFCEFCHAGNVQATDKAAAHTGLVAWNADVKAACSACHAADYEAKAQTYATALGVELDTGGGAATGGDSSSDSIAPGGGPVLAVAPPSGGTVIDFNKASFDLRADTGAPFNWGNAILVVLILGMAVGGSGFVAWREELLPKFRAWRAKPYVAATLRAQELTAVWQLLIQTQPELTELVPALANADPHTLRALARLLSDPQRGPQLVQTLSQLDPKLVEQVRQLSPRERELLMALA